MELDWNALVEERNEWVAYNFPKDSNKAEQSVFGCIEELGELVHHHLKEDQQIRGESDFHQAEAKDAIGDLTVYLLGVMNKHRVRPHYPLWSNHADFPPAETLLHLADWVGQLAFHQHQRSVHHHQQSVVNHIVMYLHRYCHARQWDYHQIVQDTWDHVRQRDWIQYPDTGMPPAHTEA